MNRGMNSPESVREHQSNQSISRNNPGLGTLGGGTPVIPQNESSVVPLENTSQTKISTDTNDVNTLDNSLPPYPYPKLKKAPQKQMISPARANSQLLEEFPSSGAKESAASIASTRTGNQLLEEFRKPEAKATTSAIAKDRIKSNSSQTHCSTVIQLRHKQIFEESTFPGFALFQMAKARYSLGRYSQALDITTECLSFQKKCFAGNKGSDGTAAAAVAAAKGVANPKKVEATNNPNSSHAGLIRRGSGDGNDTMTALDLRSTFVTGVGSSVLGVVKSLKASSEAVMDGGSSKKGKHSHHPMLSKSVAIMVSQYPSHPCVAHTLLLRGNLLAKCGLREFGEDAIRQVEMAITIQRNLAISDEEELAAPLLFLANMKTGLGRFEEADVAYREALFILREVRSSVKKDHLKAVRRDDANVASNCVQYLKRITGEIATALYLRGKSYHRQRMHSEAFGCYNNALIMLKKIGASRGNPSVERIARCMKKRCAFEKLVSGYWDDSGII